MKTLPGKKYHKKVVQQMGAALAPIFWEGIVGPHLIEVEKQVRIFEEAEEVPAFAL